MNSKQITELAEALNRQATELSKNVKRVQFIDLAAVDRMQDAIETLTRTILEICEVFDEEDANGFRKPKPAPLPALYDTLAEKAQALEGP